MSHTRRAVPSLILSICALAAPAAASAATDRWVDAQTGSNAGGNVCTSQASPCATITQASNASQSAGNFGTIHVDQGSYPEAVNIAQGNVLRADDFVAGDGGATAIAPTTGVAVFVQASATVTGFEISSPTSSAVVLVADNAKVIDNTITASGANSTAIDMRSSSGGSPTVMENVLLADSGDEDYGIDVNVGTSAARVIDNEIGTAGDGFAFGVRMRLGATGTIEGNTILGARQDGGIRGKGILLDQTGDVDVSSNLIASPVLAAGNESHGIDVETTQDGAQVRLEHNEILAMSGIGVVVADTAGASVGLEGDLIAGSSDRALYAGGTDRVRVTNATITGIRPVELNTATLAVDSSILDVPITSSGGVVSCEITNTRGPAITEGGNGCAAFQTTADPQFVAPNTFDYHLKPNSLLIDAGNPAAPAAGAQDIDGDPRALEGDGVCPVDAERDMGVDEVVVPQPDCPSPPSQPSTPDPAPESEVPVQPTPAVDRTAPETTIGGAPKQFGRYARFTVSSSEPGSALQCRLDRGKFTPCEPNFKSRRLNYGRHTLFARAIDAAGNADPTPTALKFKLKAKRNG